MGEMPLVRVYIIVRKHWSKATWRRKDLFGLFCIMGHGWLREAKAGTWWQAQKQRLWKITVCSSGLAQSAVLNNRGPPSQGWYHPWALSRQSLIKKMLYMLTWWERFLIWGPLFPNDSSLCLVDIKTNWHRSHFHSSPDLCHPVSPFPAS